MASLMTQTVKNLPAMWETQVQFLGWEDLLEEGMATRSSILAWRIPMDREAWGATVHQIRSDQSLSRVQLFVTPHAVQPGSSVHGDSLGKNTGVGCPFLLHGIFLTWGQTCVSCITGRYFSTEPPGKPRYNTYSSDILHFENI